MEGRYHASSVRSCRLATQTRSRPLEKSNSLFADWKASSCRPGKIGTGTLSDREPSISTTKMRTLLRSQTISFQKIGKMRSLRHRKSTKYCVMARGYIRTAKHPGTRPSGDIRYVPTSQIGDHFHLDHKEYYEAYMN